jgi:hypothetical protein
VRAAVPVRGWSCYGLVRCRNVVKGATLIWMLFDPDTYNNDGLLGVLRTKNSRFEIVFQGIWADTNPSIPVRGPEDAVKLEENSFVYVAGMAPDFDGKRPGEVLYEPKVTTIGI